ncbi:hypothetical protein JOD54_000091 [Actinokineospora baliensis]|uniref:DUF4407 domain-containing protein n=1 Tax=Actinokineospora baliensis TaxID=547056 RepID=UPI00195D24C8|nr:DUF4407 domain-containing protein [Actinokineospora baliensis]MBM7769887.1 hypothetical protein [Actinokineospora baliensis]
MRVALLLARLAGARPHVLRKAPGDLVRHAAMGGVLLTTAGLAGVSAFFALHSALGLSVPASAAAGVGWAVVVLNLDRMLVIGMGAVTGGWQRFLLALPRIALALVIGAVVSTPLVLRIFQPEINAELMGMRAEALEEGNRKLDEAFKSIKALTEQESGLRAVIEGRDLPAAAKDADVIRAQQRYDAAETTYRKAQAEAECELDGTCGTGRPGVGDSQRQKQREADDAKADRDRALAELNRVTAEAEKRIRDGQTSAVEAAKAKLPDVQRDLRVAQERKRVAESETADAENGNTGLMARMTALERLSDKNTAAAQARLFLFLLFLCIEILPVLVKLITSVGTKSLYDRMVDRADDDADNVDEQQVAADRAVRDMEDKAKLDLAQQRVDAQIEVGKRATDELIARQTDIALRSVTVWAELAMLRTDEQLTEWYQRNISHLAPYGPTATPRSLTTQPLRPIRLPAATPQPPNGNAPTPPPPATPNGATGPNGAPPPPLTTALNGVVAPHASPSARPVASPSAASAPSWPTTQPLPVAPLNPTAPHPIPQVPTAGQATPPAPQPRPTALLANPLTPPTSAAPKPTTALPAPARPSAALPAPTWPPAQAAPTAAPATSAAPKSSTALPAPALPTRSPTPAASGAPLPTAYLAAPAPTAPKPTTALPAPAAQTAALPIAHTATPTHTAKPRTGERTVPMRPVTGVAGQHP